MPRPPRLQAAGVLYHVTTRGNRRQAIYYDNDDCRRFASILETVVFDEEWQCHFLCLVRNHFHLLITTTHENLAAGMQRVNGTYAKSFNRRYRKEGHLFERRYFSECVKTEQHALVLLRYLALNPVRAGLCRRPEDWRWSSYAAILGRAQRPDYLTIGTVLKMFSESPPVARRRLREFVEDGLAGLFAEAA